MKNSGLSQTVLTFAILLCCLYHSDPTLAGECSVSFAAAGPFGAGTGPVSVAVGDFNGDSKLDVVVANSSSANVSVLLGNGNGTFQAAVNYPAGFSPSSVTVGDFNLDGKLDLVVTDAASAAVLVLLGNGNGTFQSAVSYAVGDNPRSVAAGDFNGDGKPDLAVANRASGDVSELFGNGNGTFQAASSYVVGVDPLFVAVGDFNGDKKRDLAVANAALFSDPPSVSVLLAKSDGTFNNAVNYVAGTSPRAIAVGDFSGDGKLDLVVANYGAFVGSTFSGSSVSVMLGNGNGSFQASVNYNAASGPISVVAADFNNDGKFDLAVANNRSASVSVLLSNGNGTFQSALNFAAGSNPVSLAAGDFNGDGQTDLAVVNSSGVLLLQNSVSDSNPPQINCPANLTLNLAPGACMSNVNYTVTAIDNCTVTNLVIVPASGSTFPVGVTAVMSTAWDSSGNTSTCVFTVRVNDTQPPLITCPADFIVSAIAGGCTSNLTFSVTASDNCALTSLVSVPVSGFAFPAGTTTVTNTARDTSGNSSTCTFTVTVTDTQLPLIACPASIAVNAAPGVCTSNVMFSVTATDNCTVTNISSVPASGFAFPRGTTTVTNTARDSSGNSSQCTFTVTVNDAQLPAITCPANRTVNAAPGVCTSNVTFSVTATDNCAVTNISSEPASGFAFPRGTTSVTSTARDSSGNSRTCTFTVTVLDNQPPQITCPANLTANAAPGVCTSNVTFTVNATDNCAVTNLASVPVSGFAFPVGTTIVTNSARDSSGNSSTCTFTVTVNDAQPPLITCPASITVNTAPGVCTSNVIFDITGTDNCAVTSFVSVPPSGFSFPLGTTTVTNRATDPSANSSQCTFTVTVNDLEPPVITCPANITVNGPPGACSSNVTFSVMASDNCAVTNLASQPPSGFAFPVGTTTVTNSVLDSSGNSSVCMFTVTVVGTPMTITDQPSNVTACDGGTGTFTAAATGTMPINVQWQADTGSGFTNIPDATSTILTVPANAESIGSYRVVFSNPCGTNTSDNATLVLGTSLSCDIDGPDTSCPNSTSNVYAAPGFNTYQWSLSGDGSLVGSSNDSSVVVSAGSSGTLSLTLQVTDSVGCSGGCTKVVTIQDTDPPVINCPVNLSVNAAFAACNSNVTFTVTATDNCAVTNISSVPASGFAFPVGNSTVTSTAWDSSGNASTCSFTVTVTDNQSPQMTCPANITANAAAGACTSNVTFMVTATDNCAVTNVTSVPASAFSFPVGTTTVTSTARDSSGNSSTCTFTVTVIDNQSPQITCPANITVNAVPDGCLSTVTFAVTASDNCAVTNLTSSPPSGFAFPFGVTTVTSTARDSSGNSRTCSFTVRVNDTQPPVITCPPNVTVTAAPGRCTSNVTFSVTASDNCVVTNVTSMPASGFAFPVGTTTVTNTARDSSGNSSTCTLTVTVNDTQPPAISCPANLTANTPSGACSNNVTFTVTATDNCAVTNISSAPASGFAFPRGTTTVTSTARDSSGNSSTCTFTVTVIDNQLPQITCPANITVGAVPGGCLSNVTFTVTASDNCTVTNLTSSPPSGFAFPIGVTTVTSSARDSSGNSRTCSFTVRVNDTQPPVITCPPNFAVTAAPGVCTSNVTFAVTATDNCAVTNVSSVPASGFAFPVGTTTVTNTARDSSGNASTCTFTVMVIDSQSPQMTCPANITVNAPPGVCASNVTFNVTATDNCAVTSVTSGPPSGSAFPVGTTTVISTAQDSNGNASQCIFTVTVNDTQPPVITCPGNRTVNATPGTCASNVTFTVTATDNCGTPDVVSVPASGFAFPVGTTTVTNQANDASGNTAQCTFTVTVNDTQPPVISCPANLTVNTAPGVCTSNVTFVVTASDNCVVTNLSSLPASGFAFPRGTTTVTSTARDSRGNASTCTFTVTVNDAQPPAITCPANRTVNTSLGTCTSNVTFSVTATDNCAVTNVSSSPASGFAFPLGSTMVTSTARDNSGNSSACTFTVTVNDAQPPAITCPANFTVNAPPGACSSNVTFTVTATDNCAVTNISSAPASGFAFPRGTTTVTNTARDSSGNSSTCTFTVTVNDTQPPQITCPANITVNTAPSFCTSNVTFTVSTSDNCAVTNIASVPTSGFAFPRGTTTVINTARDGSGNSSTCTFTVTVNDTQSPQLTCPANLTVNAAPGVCTSNATFVVTATDNCTVTDVASVPASGFAFPVGTTTVTGTARDNSGNSGTCTFTVTVLDNQPPTITCPANLTVNTALGTCTSNVTFSVTASDNCTVTNTSSVPASGFAFPEGVTLVTSTASDSSGNKSQCFFTVTVIDNQPPQITCPSNLSVNAAPGACTSNVTFTVTATDNCEVSTVSSSPSSGFAFPVGVTTVTSTAQDSSGNIASCSFTVTVIDNQPPAISCPANRIVNAAPGVCTSNVTFNVSATDNCTVTNLTSNPPSGFAFPVGVTTVTSTVRDSNGNSSTCSFSVTVNDTQPPQINCPANLTVNAAPGRCLSNLTFNVTATDNCLVTNVTSVPTSGFAFPVGVTTVTGTARDSSGNSSTCTFTVTVIDNQPPAISCPGNITVNAAPSECTSSVTFTVTASDNCTVTNVTSSPASGFAFPLGTTTVTNTARDSKGNGSTCSFTVTVIDTQPPAISCPGNITVNTAPGVCASNVTFIVNATDNCAVTNITSSPASGFAFPLGTTTVTSTVRDSGGNSSTCTFTVTVLDNQPPAITCPANITVNAAPGACVSNVTFNVTATDNCAITNLTSNPPSGFAFPVGVTTVTSTARDSSGNSSTCSFTVAVNDTQPPAITCPANFTVNALPGGCTSNVTFTVSASDNCAVTNVSSSPASGFAFPVGVTTVIGTARDSSGNARTCSFTVTVNDTQLPHITCPANLAVNAAPGVCSSNVSFTITASDNCALANVTSVPASGFAFPIGLTTVTSTARDSNGNSSTCSFTVTVNDTQPPQITCPANLTVNAAPGVCSSNVSFTIPASDNCALTNVTSVPASGFAFPIGVTTVTTTARDSNGNSSTCSFTVTVVDNQPPQISCPVNLSVNATPGVCTNNVTFTVTATDNCALTNLTSVPASGFAFPAGTTTVTSTARDSSGNSSSCSFTVTVVGTPMNITDQPANVTACNGGTATFTAAASGTLPIAVQWQANNGGGFTNLPNATTTTLSVPANASTVGSYRAVFTNPCGTNTTASATLTVGTSLSCNIDGPEAVCPNAAASLFTAPGFNTYQWSISGSGSLAGPGNTASVRVNAGAAGSYTLALQVTDTTGCLGNCSKAVPIQDLQAPVITCPTNRTVNAAPGTCTSNVTFVINATDNCAVTNLTSVPASGFAFQVGATTVTSTARDSSGNSSTCTFTVTVLDTQPPAISCPGNITVNAAPGVCLSNVTFTVSVTDNCTVTNFTSSPASGFAFPVGLTTVTSTARDSSGNSSSCSFTVTVIDNQPPQITCPANFTVNAAPGACTSNVTFTVTATDNCEASTVSSSPSSGFAFPVGVTTVTSTAQDSSGNIASCSFTVTVIDNQPPAISCPANRIVNAAPGVCTSNVTFNVSATDNCTVTNLTSNPPSGFAFPVGVTTVTSTVRDSNGNSSTCSFSVTVNDTQPPQINCPANLTVNAAPGRCLSNLTFNVTATDNCLVTNVTSVPTSGFAFPVGVTTVTGTARDSSGNSSTCTFTVTVIDNQPPAISCPGNITVNAAPSECTSSVTFTVTASDNCTVTNVTSSPASGFAFPLGTTTVTNTARDSKGNGSTCSFTVTVIDTQPPAISCPGNITVNTAPGVCASNVTFIVNATDNCAVTNITSSPASGFAFPLGTTTVTSTVRDSGGNSSTCTFTVTVSDTLLPLITCSSNRVVNAVAGTCSSNVTFVVTATDNCPGVSVVSVPASGSSFAVGTTTVTSTATDAHGNSSSCSFTVTVIDTQLPLITCPANLTVNAAPGRCLSNLTFTVTATDNCLVTNVTSVPASGFAFPVGVTTVTSTARDSSGNSSTCTFTVTVIDTQPPAISCPGNITVNAAPNLCTSNATFAVTVTDNCTVTNVTSSPASGFAFPLGTTTVTNTVRDSNGYSSTCSFTVTVIDNQPPAISCPASITVNAAPGVCTSNLTFIVNATDNCAVTNITSSPASGFAFPLGTTTVTSSARDSSGNSSMCTFTVTVRDTFPPSIACPVNLTVNTAPGACASNVTFTVSATDNCAVTNVTSSPASGFAFPLGTTMVTSTARDGSGNSSSCSFTVTVVGTPMNITDQPANVTACNGGTATFTAAAGGTLPIAVQWQGNTGGGFTNLPNATTTTLSVPANASTVGSYRAVFANPCGTNTTASATLTVGTSLSCNIDGPEGVCPNAAGSLFTAPGFHTYLWSISGNGSLVGAVNNASVLVNAGPTGSYTLALQVTDTTGCLGNCGKVVPIQDLEAPVITCPTNRTVNAAPGVCTSNVTFSVTASDNCVVTNVTSNPASGFAFPLGVTTVISTARDNSGNSSTCTFTVTVIDTQLPQVGCPANLTVNSAPGACASSVTFNVTTTDNCAVTNTSSVPPSGFAFPVGVTTVTSTARDSRGNSSSCSFTVTVIDNHPPQITCPANFTVNAASGVCTSNLNFSVTASDNCAVTNVTSVPPSGFAFPAGVTTVTSTARDSSGNSSSCSFTVTVIDNQPPQISCPANLTVNAAPGRNTSNVTFTVTASDNCALANVTSSPASGFAFPLGVTTVTSTARDSSGNSNTCTFTVTVGDNQSPTITCPANLTVNAAPGVCTSNVTFNVTASDNSGVTNVASVPPSGFAFAVGTTTVTSTARDNSGNSSTCMFTVTVIDNQPPPITCPPNVMVNAAPGTCTSNVTFAATASDNCEVANLTSSPTSGFAFPVGVTTVTSTARDSSGNSSACTFTVTVRDTQPPAISCPGNITVNAASGVCASNVTFTVTASDSCAVTSITSNPSSGFAFPVGTTTVTSTARDSSGNSSTCSFRVTVIDTQPPAIACPANLTVNAAPSVCTSNVTFAVSATDNCSVANATSAPPSGFAFPVGVTTVTSTARDGSGNSSTCTFTVTVLDNQPPVLSGLPASSLSVQCLANVPAAPTVTANDNCDGLVTVTYTPSQTGDPCNRIITRTWSAADTSGNPVRFIQTITVHDNTNPTLTKGTIASSYATVAEAEAAALAATGASDNCSDVTKTVGTVGVCPAVITVTGTDTCGNHASVTYNTCISTAGIELAVMQSGTTVTISWPFPSTGYILESVAKLSMTNWQPASEMKRTNNGRLEVTVPINQQERYFRLHKP